MNDEQKTEKFKTRDFLIELGKNIEDNLKVPKCLHTNNFSPIRNGHDCVTLLTGGVPE